jgi:RNA polymerase sigma-32 factor
VVAAIQEYVLRNSSIVRIGTTAAQKSLFFNLRRLRASLAEGPDGTMTDNDRRQIAKQLSVPLAAVERMESHITRPDQSLNMTIGIGDGDEVQDFLRDNGPSPEDITIQRHDGNTRSLWITEALNQLNDRERQIIVSRFLEEETQTLAELGEVFGVSKERVRQIEAKALGKLRVVIDETTDEPQLLLDS